MSGGGVTAATVAVIAAKKREKIFQRLRECGAFSTATAVTSEELGLPRRGMFRMQVRKGAVVEVDDGKFYIDEEAVERQQQRRRWVLLALAGLVVVGLLVAWLLG